MLTAAALLAIVAVLLAWPAPIAFAYATWPSRAPARALLLWQVIALAGAGAIIGSLALFGVALLGSQPVAAGIAFGAGIGFVLHLLGHLAATVYSVARQRHRHRTLLELLSSPHPTEAHTLVIDDGVPVAYCLPDGIGSLTVLSRGLMERLEPAELDAVIAHERAHVDQRHDLLLLAFRAWRSALPWFPIAARAEQEVAVLVELLADDRARRTADDLVLARAIVAVAGNRGEELLSGMEDRPTSRRTGDRLRRLVA